MKHSILRKIIPAGMALVLLTGCGGKKVDYDMETEQESKGVVSTLDEFREADNWDDSFTVTTSDGDVKVRINAPIDVPKADNMSVVTVEELKLDTNYKKKVLKAYFKDSEIYYHDLEHLTREELQSAIDSMDGTIISAQSQIDELESKGQQDAEQWKERLNGWKEEAEEEKKKYEKALDTAKDTYTIAEDYDNCNEYVGYCGDLLCNMCFEVKESGGNAIAYITASPLVQGKSNIYVNQYYGPQSFEYCGYEAMGAFSFAPCTLQAGEENTYIVLLGMSHSEQALRDEMREYHTRVQACKSLELLKEYWNTQNNVEYATGNRDFDQWMYWVDFQPMLRRIYGCSFLPHHDYGKGGRGWRDLWQDCLALLVMNPGGVRQMLIDNFAGVRYDGSNATIIGEKQGEFIADRNHITRVWMDHGVWPYLTTELYIRQTGDVKLLEEKVPFFKDAQIYRGEQYDDEWTEEQGCWLLTKQGVRYEASILEHLLVQHLTSFYDVGEHGEIRLRGADWNDAIDMASKRGESVAFTAAYAGNLWNLAELLIAYEKRTGQQECSILKELFLLLPEDTTIYDDIQGKKTLLKEFFATTAHQVSGEKETISIDALAEKLRTMSAFMKENIRKNEWVGNEDGMHWYNGYYDDNGRKVEGVVENNVRMMLTSQVFTIMSGTATDEQVKEIIASADKYLYDAKVGGYRLNTNFHEIKMDMGRMFGFAYGHKENGAVFSHMAVMYANALYQRGFVKEGYRVIKTLFSHSMDFETSRIYPGIPEYFNDRGRGMYHYLTGAASWLMTTVLTESFGIKGYYGDLCLEPKLMAEQFDSKGTATVCCRFQGKNIEVCYHNPEGKEYGSYCIQKVTLNGDSVRETDGKKKTILIENTRLKTIENQIEVYLA